MMRTAKLDTVTFDGESGAQYEFRVYVWRTRFKPLPGVYVIASRTIEPGAEPEYSPVYIGTAADLSKVLANHPHHECFELYLANTIAVLQEESEAVRLKVAQDLIAKLRPPCNGEEIA
ncbi:MAG TPA: hypothetical protein VIN61_18425 [Gammaproteobacteria bacterium]